MRSMLKMIGIDHYADGFDDRILIVKIILTVSSRFFYSINNFFHLFI